MTPTGAAERCHRCLQALPYHIRRCPHCGARQHVNARRLTLYASIVGIAAILALVGFTLFLKPAVDSDTTSSVESQERKDPPKPEKKPPLESPVPR